MVLGFKVLGLSGMRIYRYGFERRFKCRLSYISFRGLGFEA